MKRWWLAVGLSFALGAVMGAVLTAWRASASQARTQFIFSNRLRCRELADKYIRDASAQNDLEFISLESVDFSVPADSCIAKFSGNFRRDAGTYHAAYMREIGVNLISGEELYNDVCEESSTCANGGNVRIWHRSDAAYQQAMKGQKINVGKVK